jgi:hypothetical protein
MPYHDTVQLGGLQSWYEAWGAATGPIREALELLPRLTGVCVDVCVGNPWKRRLTVQQERTCRTWTKMVMRRIETVPEREIRAWGRVRSTNFEVWVDES